MCLVLYRSVIVLLGGGGETREAAVYRLAEDMLEKLPPDYKSHEVKERLKRMGHLQPLNIFLKQELDRMQRVISTVRTTLVDLKLAIDGEYFDSRMHNFTCATTRYST